MVRLSGPATGDALQHLLAQVPGSARTIERVTLRQPAIPALLARFTGPASYTGEDCAELQLPGNAALLDRVLKTLIQAPTSTKGRVRLAEPGEFTFRAYTAGKLDLTQAEGIAATISATCDSQLRAATLLRAGKLGHIAQILVEQLGSALALVEAGIDFTDQEDVVPIAPDALLGRLDALLAELDGLLSRSRSWGAIASPPWVVLVGPPSAGKSTLFNALLGRERAVIAPTPGTTRDVLAEPIRLQPAHGGAEAEAMLIDIAGLDAALLPTAALPDHAAQRAARDAIDRADLVLLISDGEEHPAQMIQTAAPIMHVLTKCDQNERNRDAQSSLRISAITGQGLPELRAAIARALGDRAVSITGDLLALQPRHESALHLAQQQLRETRARLAPHARLAYLPDIELLAATMRDALDALAGLGGRLTPDEVIGRVFATFCVGK